MRLWVGLGNPGPGHAGNRHNIGYMAVDRIAADHGFAPWRRAFRGQVAEGRLGTEKVLLLKPETWMNLSGESVRAALDFYKLAPADVTVFHDELDLAPGRCRLKQGGGHAGHNGLRSISAHLGEGYGRVRLGIGHPGHRDRVTAHVLGNFAKADAGWLDDLMRGISDGAPALAAGDAAGFLNAVARRTAPPRPQARPGGAPAVASEEVPGPAAAPKEVPGPAPATEPPAAGAAAPDDRAEPRSLLQRLADRFR